MSDMRKPNGNQASRDFGANAQGARSKSYGGRPQGDRPQGSRPHGEHTPSEKFGSHPQGSHAPSGKFDSRSQGSHAPSGNFGSHPQGSHAPSGKFSSHPQGDYARGERSQTGEFGSRPQGERAQGGKFGGHYQENHSQGASVSRPAHGSQGKSYGSRPQEDRPQSNRTPADRPQGQGFGTRPQADRPQGQGFGTRPQADRPQGQGFGARPQADRPQGQGFGTRPQADRPQGQGFGTRPQADRPQGQGFGTRPQADRPHANRPRSLPPQAHGIGAHPQGHGPDLSPQPKPLARPAFGKSVPHAFHKEPAHPAPEVSPARRLALQVLLDVHKNDAYASLSLNNKIGDTYFSPEDKHLATAIIYGVLENELKLDYILASRMEHPTSDPYAQNILRMGAYQVLFLDRIPESAAVNEAVNQAKISCPPLADMMNGVLRNLCREKDGIVYPDRETEPVRWLSIMSSTPEWLVSHLADALGWEETEGLLLYREEVHPLELRPNMTRLSDDEFERLLAKKVWTSERGIAPHSWKVTGATAISHDTDYLSGNFSIMGQSSILAAEALQVRPGMKVLDACAAPGGKSAYLCEKMQLTGRVYAWELHEARAKLIESAKRRLGLENLRITIRDASLPREDEEGTFDAVLLDAPCTGLGVLAQKPDIKLHIEESGIAEIVETQRALLENVCRFVKRGGSFVYSTCSVLPEENCLQIRSFLERHPEFEMVELPEGFPPELRALQTEDGLQLLPHRHGVEGFFIAPMRRRLL